MVVLDMYDLIDRLIMSVFHHAFDLPIRNYRERLVLRCAVKNVTLGVEFQTSDRLLVGLEQQNLLQLSFRIGIDPDIACNLANSQDVVCW